MEAALEEERKELAMIDTVLEHTDRAWAQKIHHIPHISDFTHGKTTTLTSGHLHG